MLIDTTGSMGSFSKKFNFTVLRPSSGTRIELTETGFSQLDAISKIEEQFPPTIWTITAMTTAIK